MPNRKWPMAIRNRSGLLGEVESRGIPKTSDIPASVIKPNNWQSGVNGPKTRPSLPKEELGRNAPLLARRLGTRRS